MREIGKTVGIRGGVLLVSRILWPPLVGISFIKNTNGALEC